MAEYTAQKGSLCVQEFKRLLVFLAESSSTSRTAVDKNAVGNELDRFNLWARNIGALQPSEAATSLGHRLRDAPELAEYIGENLDEIRMALLHLCQIMSESAPNQASPPSDTESDPIQESRELWWRVLDCITRLFKSSAIIREATPRDRFEKASISARHLFNDHYDINHVGQKFPLLDTPESQWLQHRLGQAITRRREFLKYCESHNDRIRMEIRLPENEPLTPTVDRYFSEADMYLVHSDPKQEILDTFTEASTLMPEKLPKSFDQDAESANSEASSVLSSVQADSTEVALQFPSLQSVRGNQSHFECPFCRTILTTRDERKWRKHCVKDLRPYVCTFRGCNAQPFGDRKTWFNHELENHRLMFNCLLCSKDCNSHKDLSQHLERQHQSADESTLASLSKAIARPPAKIPANHCPFQCGWEQKTRPEASNEPSNTVQVVDIATFRRHVAGHMEQLALFAVPRGVLTTDQQVDTGQIITVSVRKSAEAIAASLPLNQQSAASLSTFETDPEHSDDESDAHSWDGEALEQDDWAILSSRRLPHKNTPDHDDDESDFGRDLLRPNGANRIGSSYGGSATMTDGVIRVDTGL